MRAPVRCLAVAALAYAPLLPAQSMFRGDAAHTGVLAAAGPREFHGVKWKFATGDGVTGSPVWSEGTLYFTSDDGNLYAVDPATGVQKWKFVTRGPAPSTPAIANGLIYFGSYDGNFYAVDAHTGKLAWRFATGGERRFEAKGLHGKMPKSQTFPDEFDTFLSSPVVAQGAVVFGSGDGNVYALDTTTGDLKWKFATGDVVHASPALTNGTVFVGSWDRFLYAIDAATGKEKWRFQGGEDPLIHNQVGFQSSPAVVDGVVYVGCRDSNLYAIDAVTGKEKWRFYNSGSWVNTSPAVADGQVFFGTADSSLFHVADAATGKPVMKQQLRGYLFGSPVIAGDVVYVGALNGILEARDRKTGSVLWEFRTDSSKQNRYWALTAEGKLNPPMMFHSGWREATTEAFLLENSTGGFYSSPLVMNGVLYIGSADGYMYAIE